MEGRQKRKFRPHREHTVGALGRRNERPAALRIDTEWLFDEGVQTMTERFYSVTNVIARPARDNRRARRPIDRHCLDKTCHDRQACKLGSRFRPCPHIVGPAAGSQDDTFRRAPRGNHD